MPLSITPEQVTSAVNSWSGVILLILVSLGAILAKFKAIGEQIGELSRGHAINAANIKSNSEAIVRQSLGNTDPDSLGIVRQSLGPNDSLTSPAPPVPPTGTPESLGAPAKSEGPQASHIPPSITETAPDQHFTPVGGVGPV